MARPHVRRGASIACVVIVACGEASVPARPSAPAERPAPQAAAVPTAEPAVRAPEHEPPPRTGEVAPGPRAVEELRAARARLREARRASHGGDAPAAWAIFEELIRASPRSPELRCEGGYVALRAGALDDAREHLDAGLAMLGPPGAVPASLRVTAATCLYNRGLLHELRGETDDARGAFEASLRLRPSEAVERRLESLPSRADAERRTVQAPTPAALMVTLSETGCDLSACEDPEDASCRHRARQLRESDSAIWAALECTGPEMDDTTTHVLLALRVASGFAVHEAATGYDGGRYYSMSETQQLDPEDVTVTQRGSGAAGATWTQTALTVRSSSGYESLEIWPPDDVETSTSCSTSGGTLGTERTIVLCRGADECRSLVVLHHEVVTSEVSCSQGHSPVAIPSWAAGGDPPARPDYEVVVETTADGLRLRVARGTPPEELRPFIDRPVPESELFAVLTPIERFMVVR